MKTKDVELFVVELVYDDDRYKITDKNHLQLGTERKHCIRSK